MGLFKRRRVNNSVHLAPRAYLKPLIWANLLFPSIWVTRPSVESSLHLRIASLLGQRGKHPWGLASSEHCQPTSHVDSFPRACHAGTPRGASSELTCGGHWNGVAGSTSMGSAQASATSCPSALLAAAVWPVTVMATSSSWPRSKWSPGYISSPVGVHSHLPPYSSILSVGAVCLRRLELFSLIACSEMILSCR